MKIIKSQLSNSKEILEYETCNCFYCYTLIMYQQPIELSDQCLQYQSMKTESIKINEQNELLTQCLKISIKNLLYQFKNDNYDGNKILRVVFQLVNSHPEGKERQQVLSLWPDIELVVWNLSVSPKYWVQMFNQECFFSTEKDALDMHVFTNKIYKYILEKAKKLTPHAVRITDIVNAEVFIFLEEVSMQICDCYQRGRRIILQQTKSVEQLVKTSSIVNFYLLYKILLEISALCINKVVQQLTTTLFRNIQVSYAEEFANYIIQKHEILSLVFDNNSTKTNFQDSLFDILERVKIQENVRWREALRQDGESAIIVQFDGKDEQSAPDNYMIKMDKNGKIKVLNCNTLRMKWKITQAAEKNYDILAVVNDKNTLAQKLRNSPLKLKQITLNDHFGTFGGALGKCLAQIKNFDSVGDFMFNLSKRSVINGTFNYVATNIPLIGIMFATGGYTYTIYSIFSNRIVNKKKKIQQVGFITVDMLSSFGSGMLGAVVGQSIIPIPFLGAFLGGMVGGFIGQLSASIVTAKLQSRRFKKIIRQLQKSIQPGGYWEVNKNTLQIYNLDRQNFYNTIPEIFQNRLGADKYWFAIISFTIMSFSQSKKRAEYMQTKAKKLSKQNNRLQNYQVIFQQIKQDLNYQPSIDLMCIIKYLQNNRIEIISCYRELQDFIDKLFTRIH